MPSQSAKGDHKLSPDGITRRDFLHDLSLSSLVCALPGAGVATALADVPERGDSRQQDYSSYYPPSQTGMRGSHPGAFEQAHALAREGRLFDAPVALEEEYDLVVVGAGISGLAAAYFYRQAHGPNARILLLDNHDDFGGHAKRNEFHQEGAMRLAWGGTVNIEYPNYSEVGLQLLRDLGIEESRLLSNFDYDWTGNGTGLTSACWFDEKTYGKDVLIPGLSFLDLEREALLQALPDMPIPATAKDALRRFLQSKQKVLLEQSTEERLRFSKTTRYSDFLREQAKLPDEAIQLFSNATVGIWGLRAEDLSVAECLYQGLPGAHILELPAAENFEDGNPSAMFPDGNASIARLLVRDLIPESFPDMQASSDAMDIVTADLDYSALDREASPTRLRLNSTVVKVEHTAKKDAVAVSYVNDGKILQLRSRQCVMACYNRIIPHLCPELPETQKAGLRECIKRPMLVINVLLKNGRALQESGIAAAYLPGSMLQMLSLVSGINTGSYRGEWDPDKACVVQFFSGVRPEHADGLSISEQDRAGRARLLQMDFKDFEDEVFRVLRGVWGQAGLVPERDVSAITVNRWPHGYARDRVDMEDPAWLATPGPVEIGRQPFGKIAIANSDAGADAYTHTAIDQAWRAVQDLARQSGQT